MSPQANLATARAHLASIDPVLARVIQQAGEIDRRNEFEDPYLALVKKIVSQQVSVASARAVFRRLTELVDGQFLPEKLRQYSQEELRAVGISRQKYGYIQDLSRHFMEAPERFLRLPELSNEEVAEALVSVRGIGQWSAEMFLMFNLGRLDVFAPDDVGLKNGMIKLYGLENPKRKELAAFAERWAPYRTVACWYIWWAAHNTPDPE